MAASNPTPFARATTIARPAASTNTWFASSNYGIGLHFLSNSTFNYGRDWNTAVAQFDVEGLAQDAESAGAAYVIFTLGQTSGHWATPNATLNRIVGAQPGQYTSNRDLPLDLAAALRKRGIKLLLYMPSDPSPVHAAALGWPNVVDPKWTDQYAANWTAVAAEWGARYRDHADGWWIDGAWVIGDDRQDYFQAFKNALQAGDPNKLVAFNPSVSRSFACNTPHQNYFAGERVEFDRTPLPAAVTCPGLNGPLQWHVFAPLGSDWGQPDASYSNDFMIDYIREVNAEGGVVSMDVTPNAYGRISPAQLSQLRAIKRGIRGGEPRGTWINIAEQLPASSVSAQGGVNAVQMVDGVVGNDNGWRTNANSGAQSLTIDLGEAYYVHALELFSRPTPADSAEYNNVSIFVARDAAFQTAIRYGGIDDGAPSGITWITPGAAALFQANAGGVRYVRVIKRNSAASFLSEMKIFGTPVAARDNVALNKPVDASGSYNDAYGPRNINDGRIIDDNGWAAMQGGSAYTFTQIDLGRTYDVESIELVTRQNGYCSPSSTIDGTAACIEWLARRGGFFVATSSTPMFADGTLGMQTYVGKGTVARRGTWTHRGVIPAQRYVRVFYTQPDADVQLFVSELRVWARPQASGPALTTLRSGDLRSMFLPMLSAQR
jgi:hypothetical protein